MSTRPTDLSQPFAGAGNPPWRAFALAFVMTVLSVIVFVAVFALALVTLNAGKIVPGTVVAGVPLGGLDRTGGEVRLRERLPSLSAGHISVRFGDLDKRIEYSQIGRDYDMAAMLDQAYAIGREGDVLTQAQSQLSVAMRGASVDPRVRWDEAALEGKLNELALAAATEPVDAAIVRDGARFVVKPSAPGTSVDVNSAWQQALATVGTLSVADTQVSVAPVSRPPTITTEQAQLAVDRVERVAGTDLTLSGGGVSQVFSSDTIRGWIRLEPAGPGSWTVVIERAPVTQAVAQVSESVYKETVDASFKWHDGNVAAVPGSAGRQLDVDATSQAAYDALVGRVDGPPISTVQLSISSVDPTFTTAQAVALAPRFEKVSSWTTPFIPSERNFFGANIRIPTGVIDGTVILPGATFDFWATVGNLSDLPGIGLGGAIINGRTNPTGALGGGICSVSTTLFNAALRAGLEMGDRRAHAYYINRYPTGLDATVWRSGSVVHNMTWINDTDYPIIIRGVTKVRRTGTAAVTFELWSLPINRDVSFSQPIIETIKVAGDFVKYVDQNPDGSPLAAGAMVRLEYPTNGFQSWVTRTVRDGGTVIHSETYYSKYVRVDGLTLIGWQEGDPPNGTQLPSPNPLSPIQPPEAGTQ